MLKNFLVMPPLLKLLTASTIALIAFVAVSMFPHGSITVFGRHVSNAEWWMSGAGAISTVTAGLLIASAILMLKGSRYGRPAYILGWVVISLSIPALVDVTKGNVAGAVPSMMFNLLASALIALYLYRSKAVTNYFRAVTE